MPDTSPAEKIASQIIEIRGRRVILASELAQLYGVSTKRLNEQIKRNLVRFPDDFAFRLTKEERDSLRSQIATSKGRGGDQYLPWAFTEHGVIQAANVLNSDLAIKMGILVVRVFVAISGLKLSLPNLEDSVREAHARLDYHDQVIDNVIGTLKSFGSTDEKRRRRKIGFK
jgi:hypothetical protein